jgi:hypothetical protein
VMPGPGAYMSRDARSLSQKGRYSNFSKFGTGAERFAAQQGSALNPGPGQYRPERGGHKSAMDKHESQNFKSPSRKDLFSGMADAPGPGDYMSEKQLSTLPKAEKNFS